MAGRYTDSPLPLATRLLGMAGTACVLLVPVGIGLWQLANARHPAAIVTPAMTLVDIAAPQAPPVPPSERPPAPERSEQAEPVEKRNTIAPPLQPPPQLPAPAPAPSIMAIAQPVALSAEGAISTPTAPAAPIAQPAASQASAPQSRPVPPAAKASDEQAQWASHVLAALNRAKRYPPAAKRQRQEGTSIIRFTVDRRGHVRATSLQRSSGFESLDDEALSLPTRAQPLPRPPRTIPGHRIDLTVPIEFFLA